MTITGGSALPKDEIDRMVKEAEAHAEEDKKRREETDLRNSAEQTVYAMEKMLKENEDKVSEDVAAPVREAIDAVKKALDGDDIEKVKSAMEDLNAKAQKIGEAIYAAAAAEQAGSEGEAGTEGSASGNGEDDDIIDAEVVDDDK